MVQRDNLNLNVSEFSKESGKSNGRDRRHHLNISKSENNLNQVTEYQTYDNHSKNQISSSNIEKLAINPMK